MRDVLIHDYFGVDLDIVSDVALGVTLRTDHSPPCERFFRDARKMLVFAGGAPLARIGLIAALSVEDRLRLSQNRFSETERGDGSFTAEQFLMILAP